MNKEKENSLFLLGNKPQTYKQTKTQTKTKSRHITRGAKFLIFSLYSLFQNASGTNAFSMVRKFH